jgi:hypothetical protein
VVSPIDGEVEVQIVARAISSGGRSMFSWWARRLRACRYRKTPARRQADLRCGCRPFGRARDRAKIDEIRPTVGTTNRALDAIVKFDNDGTFRGGGSVNAKIVLAVRENALTVPEQSVVLRPAGKVVYVVTEQDGRLTAQQRVVETGIRQEGFYEILKGLAPGDRVAVDGAGFLSNGAVVALPKPAAGKGVAKEDKGGDRGGADKGGARKG